MGTESKIGWTNHTWNPWHGCTKVSPGCKFCYMYRDKDRYGLDPTIVQRSKANFNKPLSWKDPAMVFTCSWSDWFIKDADEWRPDAWKVIKETPHLTYQILTKRPERIIDHLPPDWGEGYPNVWIGVSVESQDYVTRIDHLIDVPANTLFASFEPLIGKVSWDPDWNDLLDWIIIGGESGNDTGKWGYRPMEMNWAEHLAKNAKNAGIPVFVKQAGTYLAKKLGLPGAGTDGTGILQLKDFPL